MTSSSVRRLAFVLGLALVFHPSRLTATIHLGTSPTWRDLAFAMPIGVIAFTGLEAAASLAGEVAARQIDLKRLLRTGSLAIVLIYVGIAVVGVGALPVRHGMTALGQDHLKAPVLGVVEAFKPKWVADVLK